MHNSNSMTSEGFIESLTHPRKVELAKILLADDFNTEEVDIEGLTEKGFNRMTAIEMGRDISRSVEGMEDFSIDWPRDTEAEATGKETAAANQVAAVEAAKVAAEEKVEADKVTAEADAKAAGEAAAQKVVDDAAAAEALAKTDQALTADPEAPEAPDVTEEAQTEEPAPTA